jgi:hypothetical protein
MFVNGPDSQRYCCWQTRCPIYVEGRENSMCTRSGPNLCCRGLTRLFSEGKSCGATCDHGRDAVSLSTVAGASAKSFEYVLWEEMNVSGLPSSTIRPPEKTMTLPKADTVERRWEMTMSVDAPRQRRMFRRTSASDKGSRQAVASSRIRI